MVIRHCPSLLFLLALAVTDVGSLKDVQLEIPTPVSPGETATLICNYDLEGEPLYTVTWYKGRQEFFRFVPKELPHTRVFPLPGVHVDLSMSGLDRVVLQEVGLDMTGKYRCEVSTDAPNFETKSDVTQMHVIGELNGEPILHMEKGRYAVGDVIRGNCSSPASLPPANITWFVNGHKVNSSFVARTKEEDSMKVTTTAGIEMLLNESGRLRIQCVADLYHIRFTKKDVILEEERPRLASVLGTRESDNGGYRVSYQTQVWFLLLTGLLAFCAR
ncbi:uncharacterized protein LOC142321816 [Lycorma delicatula]|uniref:uncharacterized protein LOC142321816 n=1 Tax=Lycorma delicatula TaxID=130591 RepID=UPI003F518C1A